MCHTPRYLTPLQGRILDLEACIAARRWSGGSLPFNVRIADPITDRIQQDWPGVGGECPIVVGDESYAEPGHSGSLATLEYDVSALTRLWLGVVAGSH